MSSARRCRWESTFTSSNIPAGDGTDTSQGQGRVSLSTVARGTGGGDVTTTFKRAEIVSAEGGHQGVVPVLPTTLTFPYEDGVPISGAMTPDGETLASASTGNIPFQRYDLEVPGARRGPGDRVERGRRPRAVRDPARLEPDLPAMGRADSARGNFEETPR